MITVLIFYVHRFDYASISHEIPQLFQKKVGFLLMACSTPQQNKWPAAYYFLRPLTKIVL